jgi:hypothetical protein
MHVIMRDRNSEEHCEASMVYDLVFLINKMMPLSEGIQDRAMVSCIAKMFKETNKRYIFDVEED